MVVLYAGPGSVREYAWRAALLAYTYRALYTRTHVDSRRAPCSGLTFFVPLIQEHINVGCPRRAEVDMSSFLGAVLGVYGSLKATCFVVFITSVISLRSSGLKRFLKYADDIVIEDRHMTTSKEKSLISDRGCLKFAKQFLIKKDWVNISPVSVPMVRALVHSLSVAPTIHKDRPIAPLLEQSDWRAFERKFLFYWSSSCDYDFKYIPNFPKEMPVKTTCQ
ncbi:conserved hypothetical protein [Ricinus communis]|uniref:Uncharacterized protein n=1 Tax=Ricinus communis TaxID=3988 RepID=B9RSA3_RICCO|nr:conserved hypothetical protein [Ricinus communis]